MSKAAKQSKTTFRIDPKALEDFQYYVAELGLRRDKYLNRILPDAIQWLKKAKKNSPTAERFWKSMRDVRGDKLQKVAVLLDARIVKDMNAVCADKRVPRDHFFQTFLESLVHPPANGNGPAPLPKALGLIQDPWEVWYDGGEETPFDGIIWSDFDEDDLREAIHSLQSDLGM